MFSFGLATSMNLFINGPQKGQLFCIYTSYAQLHIFYPDAMYEIISWHDFLILMDFIDNDIHSYNVKWNCFFDASLNKNSRPAGVTWTLFLMHFFVFFKLILYHYIMHLVSSFWWTFELNHDFICYLLLAIGEFAGHSFDSLCLILWVKGMKPFLGALWHLPTINWFVATFAIEIYLMML